MNFRRILGHGAMSLFLVSGAWLASFSVETPPAHAIAAIQGERAMPAYWLDRVRDADRLLMKPEQVARMNQIVRQQGSTLLDLAHYPAAIQASELRKKMSLAMKAYSGWELPRIFKDGRQLSWEDWKAVKDNCGYDVPRGELPVGYAVTVRRADLRRLPVADAWTAVTDPARDEMQAMLLDPAEPVVVLWRSVDGIFSFVQTRNYLGWVETSALGFADREQWLRYAAPPQYMMVVVDQRTWIVNGKELKFRMSAHIPALEGIGSSWRVILPTAENGRLVDQEMVLNADQTLHAGPLPCRKGNIIRQAFRLLGAPYSYGCKNGGWDAPSFVSAVYRSVGIDLPQDVAEQEHVMLNRLPLEGMNSSRRYAAFFNAEPMSLLFSPKHVMLYLGMDGGGEPIVIHAMDGKQPQVMLSDLHFAAGEYNDEMLSLLTSIGSIF